MANILSQVTSAVTVVLATHNGARFLREQLHSLSAQSLPPAAIIKSPCGSFLM
jgi:GT2 family glycosyltransferase